MGGIVGYLGNREARQILIECLGRLDERGYDSAGMGTVAGGKLKTLHSLGNSTDLAGIKATLKRSPLGGKVGVVHVYRSGRGQVYNAHLHNDGNFLAIVHDGSRDNDHAVARLLERDGISLEALLPEAVALLKGDFSLVGLSQKEPDRIITARRGSRPLYIAQYYDGYFVTSDLPAISHFARSYQILEDGEKAIVSYTGVAISKFDGSPVQRALTQLHSHASQHEATYQLPAFMARSVPG